MAAGVDDTSPELPVVGIIETNAAVRWGWRIAAAWAIRPPKDMPTTRALDLQCIYERDDIVSETVNRVGKLIVEAKT